MVSSVVLTILASYTILCVLLTLVIASFVLATLWKRSSSKLSGSAYHSGKVFVVARGAGNMWMITWSFLGGVYGAWMPPALGSYGYSYGLVGMLCFCTATALEPMVCVVLSTSAYKQLRETNSFPQSIGARYGHTLEAFTVAVMLLAATLSFAAELVGLADMFESVMGIDRLIVFAVAAMFSVYSTFVGGALVGLIMSQFNGMIAMVTAVAVLGFFLDSAKHFKPPSTHVLHWGIGTKATMSAIPGAVYFNLIFGAFYEVYWQKHIWCRQKSELWPAACYTGIIGTAFGLLWGAAGMVAAWKDAAEGTSYYDAQLPFILYADRYWKGANVRSIWEAQHYWFGVTLLIMIAVSAHAAIDGWNSALLSSVYGSMRMPCAKKHRLNISRAVVMALNALAFAAAVMRLDSMGLYTIANTIGACLLCPLFLSVCIKRLFALARSRHILLSSLSGLVACSAYGMAAVHWASNGRLSSSQVALQGLQRAFYKNNYEWPFLVLSLFVPLVVYACCIQGSSMSRATVVAVPKHWPHKQHQTAASDPVFWTKG